MLYKQIYLPVQILIAACLRINKNEFSEFLCLTFWRVLYLFFIKAYTPDL